MSTAVLIVNYRTYAELHRCLSSLIPYLRPDDEVVVVDYESDRLALEGALAVPLSVIALPRNDNLGFAAGVNLAAARTRAPFLLLLNPDTVVEGPIIQVLEDFLTSHADAAVAGPRVLNADGTVQPSARRFPDLTTWLGGRTTWLTSRFPGNWLSRRNLVGRDAQSPLEVDWVSGACMMTRRAVFERVGRFDEGFFLYWEDADYCFRVASAGFRRFYLPEAGPVRHLAGRSAQYAAPSSIRAFHRSAFHLYWKHASALEKLAAPVVRLGLWLRGERRARQSRQIAPDSRLTRPGD